jgi:predicted dehydrogenase
MSNSDLRVAIVGCGKIADQHVQAIDRIRGCRIVALCDRESLMARQLGERCGVSQCFSDLTEMLAAISPDVVHITTPPQAHFSLARLCLESGSHVYLEKPFTVTAAEADSLIEIAENRGLKLTAGHNCQFTREAIEMRRLAKQGFLGEKPVHLESYFSYDLGDRTYVGPLLANRSHWVRQLPGQLLHNLVSHGIAKLAEFLDDEIIETFAMAGQSPQLASLNGEDVFDELRVLIRDKSGTTAFFLFSTQIKPGTNQLRIYGPRNSLVLDQNSSSLLRGDNRSYKSYLTFFVPGLQSARENIRNAWGNMRDFLSRNLYQDYGMTELIRQFYRSIKTSEPPPIPYREILLTAKIMDEIFAQIYDGSHMKSKAETYACIK